jgi:hypothetical protein
MHARSHGIFRIFNIPGADCTELSLALGAMSGYMLRASIVAYAVCHGRRADHGIRSVAYIAAVVTYCSRLLKQSTSQGPVSPV